MLLMMLFILKEKNGCIENWFFFCDDNIDYNNIFKIMKGYVYWLFFFKIIVRYCRYEVLWWKYKKRYFRDVVV